MIITCPHCSQSLEVDKGLIGQQLNCPACSILFVVPVPIAIIQKSNVIIPEIISESEHKQKQFYQRRPQTIIHNNITTPKERIGCGPIALIVLCVGFLRGCGCGPILLIIFSAGVVISLLLSAERQSNKMEKIENVDTFKQEMNEIKAKKNEAYEKELNEACRNDVDSIKRTAYEIFSLGAFVELTESDNTWEVFVVSRLRDNFTSSMSRNEWLGRVIKFMAKTKDKRIYKYKFIGRSEMVDIYGQKSIDDVISFEIPIEDAIKFPSNYFSSQFIKYLNFKGWRCHQAFK